MDDGGRIWVGWDSQLLKIQVIHCSSQAIFLDVLDYKSRSFVVTIVYGSNDGITKGHLWRDINAFAGYNNKPWVLLGDFNSLLSVNDKTGGATEVTSSLFKYFYDCTREAHIFI